MYGGLEILVNKRPRTKNSNHWLEDSKIKVEKLEYTVLFLVDSISSFQPPFIKAIFFIERKEERKKSEENYFSNFNGDSGNFCV